MSIFALELDDFSDDNYKLIGIHTTLEDYRLAFFLNKFLNAKFKRSPYNLDFKNKNYDASYSIFEYEENAEIGAEWFLIANIFSAKLKSDGLFPESETKAYLIPEKKKVDYFLKIEGDCTYENASKLVEQIQQVPQVITAYIIETNTLKSKEFLIF